MSQRTGAAAPDHNAVPQTVTVAPVDTSRATDAHPASVVSAAIARPPSIHRHQLTDQPLILVLRCADQIAETKP
jgi:hypothetical protein